MLKVTREYKRWNKSKKKRSNNISFGGHVEYSCGQDWIQFYYVIGLKNIWIHCPIGFVADLFFFHSGQRIQKYPELLANSQDACACIRKGKFADSKDIRICVDRAYMVR